MTSIYFAAVCESSRVRIDYEGSRLIEEGILILTVRVKVYKVRLCKHIRAHRLIFSGKELTALGKRRR